jgi:hypothetical protein
LIEEKKNSISSVFFVGVGALKGCNKNNLVVTPACQLFKYPANAPEPMVGVQGMTSP